MYLLLCIYCQAFSTGKISKFILFSGFVPFGMFANSKKKTCNILSRNRLNDLISPTFEYILCILPVHSIWIKFVFLAPLFLIRFLQICTQKILVLFKPFYIIAYSFLINLNSKCLASLITFYFTYCIAGNRNG